MRTLLNIIWVVFGGFWLFLSYLFFGLIACLLIVFDPEQRAGLAITAVFLVICYVGYWGVNRRVSL